MIIFFWLAFAILVAVFAANKGRNWFLALLAALILSPLIGFIIVLCLRDKKRERAEAMRHADLVGRMSGPLADANSLRSCPMCAEPIQRAAVLCRHCRSPVTPERPEAV